MSIRDHIQSIQQTAKELAELTKGLSEQEVENVMDEDEVRRCDESLASLLAYARQQGG